MKSNKPERILHISKYYFPFRGGTEQIAQECVNALKETYEQKVFCYNDVNQDQIDEIDGISVVRAGCLAKVASQPLSRSYGKLLKETMKSFAPDIVVFHYPNPFAAAFLLRYLPAACKLVIYWHLDIIKQKVLKQFFRRQNDRLVERANLIIATSPAYVEGSEYLSKVPEKCSVIPNCINVQRMQLSAESKALAERIRTENDGKVICLAVGRHTEYKGFKYLIRAAHLLDDRFQIFITGEGEETDNLKKEAGDDKKIHFLGLVEDKKLKAYLEAMDIFCFPSITKNEAFGLALAEAMYYGKPAVTFTIPGSGVNYVCVNRENGIEVPNRDIVRYAEAMTELADHPALRKEYGTKGKKRVEEKFLNTQFERNIREAIHSL